MEIFAAAFVALYVGHHVGDYWVQTDHQARHKGDASRYGQLTCLLHVISYIVTQVTMLTIVGVMLGMPFRLGPLLAALAVSGLTHYTADRREHGLMFWLARRIGLTAFLKLGVPRAPRFWIFQGDNVLVDGQRGVPVKIEMTDNPSLGTGAWALDQSWHLFFGVFVPALVLAA